MLAVNTRVNTSQRRYSLNRGRVEGMIGANKLAEWSLLFQMFLISQVKVSCFRGLVLVGDASTGGGTTSDILENDNQRPRSITPVYTV